MKGWKAGRLDGGLEGWRAGGLEGWRAGRLDGGLEGCRVGRRWKALEGWKAGGLVGHYIFKLPDLNKSFILPLSSLGFGPPDFADLGEL